MLQKRIWIQLQILVYHTHYTTYKAAMKLLRVQKSTNINTNILFCIVGYANREEVNSLFQTQHLA
jgi:hypothetical protein